MRCAGSSKTPWFCARGDAGHIGGPKLEQAIADLEARADRILAAKVSHPPNCRLLAHLANEREALFTFLRRPGVPTTNHDAERGLRPKVCQRKNWGGNKSLGGARSSAVTASVIRTAAQQGLDPIAVLMAIATSDGAHSGLDLPDGPGP
jgi:hypothetical protein